MAIKELDDFRYKMERTIETYEEELNTIRVGRANPHILDRLTVDYYGTPTAINQVGNITVPEARQLVITPWDSTLLKPIERAIQMSDIGINPSNDGKCIRLSFPEMTEDKRKETSKDVRKRGENAKVAIRNVRREAMDNIKLQRKDNILTEDDQKNAEEDLQKLTDEFIGRVDKTTDKKIAEIMQV